MAKVVRPKPPISKPPKLYKPHDFLKGSHIVGKKYTSWNTYGQGKPDFGKEKGPGDPYREIEKTVPTAQVGKAQAALERARQAAQRPTTQPSSQAMDPRAEAIRRRLRGL